jgi:hypothetical protein
MDVALPETTLIARGLPADGGSTGTRTQDQRIKNAEPIADTAESSGDRDGLEREGQGEDGSIGQSQGNHQRKIDPLATLDRLTTALERASAAGAWDAVALLAAEVKAWREANAGVVSLEAARSRRGKG